MQERLVTVEEFVWLVEADVATAALRGYGIECFLADDHFILWFPYCSLALGGVKLRVKESDVPDAIEILQWPAREVQARCPNCDSANVLSGARCGWFMFGLCAFFLIPLRPLRRNWQCEDCGFRWKSRNGLHVASARLFAIICTLIALRIVLWQLFCI